MDVDKMLLNKIKNLKMYKIISSNYKLNNKNMFNNILTKIVKNMIRINCFKNIFYFDYKKNDLI